MALPQLPAALMPLFWACRNAGGRALLVGGSVRDALLGILGKDLDIEVHGLELGRLLRLLRPLGPVNEVGRSFGVLKLRIAGGELDVSVPRRDRQGGTGHRGIEATADPFLGTTEAARRRDLTINAIAWDPLEQEFIDPFGGRGDLEARLLRAVDPHSFGEDPLRALRVAQFVGRFGFTVDPSLEDLCLRMPLADLPAERIHGEVDKLLLKSVRPSDGWNLAFRTGMWDKVLPEWGPCPPLLDARAAQSRGVQAPRRRALLYAAACGHCTLDTSIKILDRLRLFRWEGYRLREQVLFLISERDTDLSRDAALRWAADRGDLELLSLLRGEPALRERAERLGVLAGPLPPLLLGRDLIQLGVPPGDTMGRLLDQLRHHHREGQLDSREDALAWVKAQLA